MSKKILCIIYVFSSAHASERIPGYGFTPEEWQAAKENVYEHIQNEKDPLQAAQKLLAKNWPVPSDMLFKSAVQRPADLVLFFVGVAGVNSATIREGSNALSALVRRLPLFDRVPEMFIKNLVYVGVPLKHSSAGEEFDAEQSLRDTVKKSDDKKMVDKAQAALICIRQAKKEVTLAQEAYNKKKHNALVQSGVLDVNSASIVVAYAKEHVIPDRIQKKMNALAREQRIVQQNVESETDLTDCKEVVFCCCG